MAQSNLKSKKDKMKKIRKLTLQEDIVEAPKRRGRPPKAKPVAIAKSASTKKLGRPPKVKPAAPEVVKEKTTKVAKAPKTAKLQLATPPELLVLIKEIEKNMRIVRKSLKRELGKKRRSA
jgi:hypothetical protein